MKAQKIQGDIIKAMKLLIKQNENLQKEGGNNHILR